MKCHTRRVAKEAGAAAADPSTVDLTGNTVDYYALPDLCATMRVNRYGLVQQILDTPLLRLDDTLPRLEVRHGTAVVA